jgi:hypothetical protein
MPVWQLDDQAMTAVTVNFADYFECLTEKRMTRESNSNAL